MKFFNYEFCRECDYWKGDEKMSKACWIWVMVLVAASLMVIPSAGGETTERKWLVLGQEYNLTGTEDNIYPSIKGDVRVEPGEVVTVNWWNVTNVTVAPGQQAFERVTFSTNIPSVNWSSNLTNGNTHLFLNNASGSAWLRAGGYDIISVDMRWWVAYNYSSGMYEKSTISFNITVTRDDYTFGPDTRGLEDKIDALQGQLDALNASIGALNSAMLDSITSLRDSISGIRVSLDSMNLSENADVVRLQDQLDSLNTSIAMTEVSLRALMDMNDTALRALIVANYADLVEQLRRVNVSVTNITNVTNNITERVEYNDSALWLEVNHLNSTPPLTIVSVNNTTVVNRTEVKPTTFVNKTQSITSDDILIGFKGVAGGAISGGVAGAVVVLVALRGRKENLA